MIKTDAAMKILLVNVDSRWNMADIMGQPIDWAPSLLLLGDGYDTKFYMED